MSIEINYKRIGSYLAIARKRNGLKQKDVACHMDVADNTVSNMERGKQELSLQRIIELCVLYGIKPGSVLDDCCDELLTSNAPPEMHENADKVALYVIINKSSDKTLQFLRILAESVIKYIN